MRLSIVLVVLVALAALAAPARGDDCDDARAAVARKDLVRASIAAAGCDDEALLADLERRATAKGMSPVEVITSPAGGTVVVELAADLPFTTPRRIWLPEGRHQVTGLVDGAPVASALVIARDGNRTVALIELPAPAPPPGTGTIDFEEEGGGEMQSGPPEKVELPSLLPDKYLRGVDATGADPAEPRPRRRSRWKIAVGVAVGVAVISAGVYLGSRW